jgi:hypothetical protein
MAMAKDDMSVWEKARQQLVIQRQSVIEALAKGDQPGQTANHIDLLLKIQAAIDVLDSAEDEGLDDEDED